MSAVPASAADSTAASIPQLGGAVWPLAVRYHHDPLRVLQRAQARHGPVFALPMPWKPSLVVVADPEAADAVIGLDPGGARAGEARRTILPQASPPSPFGSDGDAHEEVRARVVPWFSAARVDERADELRRVVCEQIDRWPAREVRLLPHLRTLTTSVLVRVALGIDDPVRSRALVAAIRHLLWTPGNPPMPVPARDDGLLGRSIDAVYRRRVAWVRRALPDERFDVDEWAVVFAAAQEPPAIALTNVVLKLARAPGSQVRIAAGDVDHLDAVVREALRLRPAASGALRRLTRPTEAAGIELPAGTTVLLPSLLLHRDAQTFDYPDEFRPERWATLGTDVAGYRPFGDGARRCLGEVLAHAQLRCVVPELLRRRRVDALGTRPERMAVRGTVLAPVRSGRVRLTGR